MKKNAPVRNRRWSHLFSFLILLFILALALFVRAYHLGTLPGGLYPDEATNGTDALQAIETGQYRLFYENNYGREGLFINLQALAVKFFGNTIGVLRSWSAIFGTLFVWGMYLLGRELYHRRAAGLIAAFIAATAYWTINFSHIGFRAIMMPFILSFTLYFFFKGLESRYWKHFLYSGLFLGVGLHTYVAFRLVPVIFILLLPILFLAYDQFWKHYWKPALAFILGAFITAAPMFYDFAVHPEHIASRTGAVSVFSEDINHGHLLLTLGKMFGLSLVKYNFYGDQNWRHNYPPYPILDPIVGTAFLAGLLFILFQTLGLLKKRFVEGVHDERLTRNWILIVVFFSMLAPEFLSGEGLPHALRAIGTQPAVFLIASLPLLWLYDYARQARYRRFVLLSVFFFLLIGSAAINLSKYFIFFAENPNQTGAFNKNFTNMSEYLISLPPETQKYVYANAGGTMIGNGFPVTAQPILFLTHGKVQNLTFLNENSAIRPSNSVIILMAYDGGIIDRLKSKFPNVITEKIDLSPGTASDFTVLRFP